MTMQKHLKERVRSRMQKTGESYTTARHHILNQPPTTAAPTPVDPVLRWHFPGNIPATTALRTLLSHAGVRNPRTGEPFSEALLFVIAGGIGVGMFTFFYEKENVASFFNQREPRFPVFGVVARDAAEFAKWLGGKNGFLPSLEQWDKAAGVFDQAGRRGPFEGIWNPESEGQIAVKRKVPMKVGEALQDRSLFFVRDMSGNGKEWTRTRDNPLKAAAREKLDIKQQKKGLGGDQIALFLRGRDYVKETPLYYEHLDSLREGPGQEFLDADPQGAIGFRVVIEP
jgi:hypothetical protein